MKTDIALLRSIRCWFCLICCVTSRVQYTFSCDSFGPIDIQLLEDDCYLFIFTQIIIIYNESIKKGNICDCGVVIETLIATKSFPQFKKKKLNSAASKSWNEPQHYSNSPPRRTWRFFFLSGSYYWTSQLISATRHWMRV